MTLADLIDRNAGFAPDKVALRFAGEEITYRAFARRIEAAAAGLAQTLGIGRGDRIAHLGVNSADFLVLLFAAARLGATVVPMNWRLAPPEHAYILANAEPKVLLVEREFAATLPALQAAVPSCRIVGFDAELAGLSFAGIVDAGRSQRAPRTGGVADPLLIVYTSGTTGRPKGAVLTQDAIRWNAVNATHMHGLMAADHVLTVLPMFHVGGLNIQTTPALIAGATVTIHPRFAPGDTLAAIARERPTLVVLVPATLQAMMMHPDFAHADLSSLRVITTGSTIVAESFVTAFATRGIRVIQVYGSTETCPVVVYERFDCPRLKPDTTGVAGLINEAAVVDDKGREVAPGEAGEIVVRGANLFSGYWRDPVATEAAFRDGWYLTGDIGTRDTDGHFAVRERKRNVIISGGENIYPAEVERVIGTFPGVADCAVVARADERWAEVPVAFVVPAPGAALDIGALERHVGASLARFKQPRAYHLREVLPKNALGKVQHFALKAELAAAGQ